MPQIKGFCIEPLALIRAMPADVRAAFALFNQRFGVEHEKASFWVNIARLS
jgi:hypothetical protein